MLLREQYISCKVSSGLFRGERVVEFKVQGETYRTVVDRRDVIEKKEPSPDKWVDGLLRVRVLKKNKETILIDLPRETVTSGKRMFVPPGLLQSA